MTFLLGPWMLFPQSFVVAWLIGCRLYESREMLSWHRLCDSTFGDIWHWHLPIAAGIASGLYRRAAIG